MLLSASIPRADNARLIERPADCYTTLISGRLSKISTLYPWSDRYFAITGPVNPAPISEICSLSGNGFL